MQKKADRLDMALKPVQKYETGSEMKNEVFSYLLQSVLIIKKNFFPFLLLLIFSVLNFGPLIQDAPGHLILLLTPLLTIYLYPSVLGQYTEIVLRQRQIAYWTLFKRHCLNFVVVSFILGSPFVVISGFDSLFSVNLKFLGLIYAVVISSISIYVFPLLFIHGKRLESIKIGFQCLLGNLRFNLPLILIVSVSSVFTFIFQDPGVYEKSTFGLILYCSVLTFSYLIEFWFFVAAILILKDKGLAET